MSTPQRFDFRFKAFGGENTFCFYHANKGEAQQVADELIADICQFQDRYSRYKDNSVIAEINASAGGTAVRLDEEASALVDYAFSCHQQSQGMFDVTSGVLRRVWDFKNGRVPSKSEVKEILPLVGLDKVEWKKPFIKLTQAEMQLDFGGFGKEYAVDRAANFLLHRSITSGMLNFAGDVRVLGPKFGSNEGWNIGVVHPRKVNSAVGHLTLSRGAIATSGDYERYFEIEEKRYCHILNPKTGWPVTGLQSVTVISDACLLAGSFATMAMLLGEKKGKRLLSDSALKYVMISENGRVQVFPKSLSLERSEVEESGIAKELSV